MTSAALSRARLLLQPRRRREARLFLAEGRNVIVEALAAGVVPLEAFAAAKGLRTEALELVSDLRACGVTVHEIDPRALREIAATATPQGVVAVLPEPEPPADPFAAPGLWLLLDRIQDPGNVGTLLRAAEAFGAAGALAVRGTADLWSPRVVRAGQGAHLHLALLRDVSGETGEEPLAGFLARGGELWAAETGGQDVYAAPAPPALCMLAVGNEAGGLSPALLAAAARRVAVPQRGRTESLNVAMAASVLLSWLAREGR